MAITFRPETLDLIESQMKSLGCSDPDEFIEKMICEEFPIFSVDVDLLDLQTRLAVEEGDHQIQHGLGVTWDECREEILAKFGKR